MASRCWLLAAWFWQIQPAASYIRPELMSKAAESRAALLKGNLQTKKLDLTVQDIRLSASCQKPVTSSQ